MSIVMDALRQVEKPGSGPGSIGTTVASYTRTPPRRGPAIPLLLGLASGGAMVFLFDPSSLKSPSTDGAVVSAAPQVLPRKGGAGLPPPLIPATASASDSGTGAANVAPAEPPTVARTRAAAAAAAPAPTPAGPLTLQAISERDSQPIAVINERLVRVGDRIGLARVVKIGPDFVDLVHDNGRTDTLRFNAHPPEAAPTPDRH